MIFRDQRRVGFASARTFRIPAGHHVVGNTFRIAPVFPAFAPVTAFTALFADWIAHGKHSLKQPQILA